MLSLDDLPPEVILERVLPQLPLKDLLSLSATSKTVYDLCNDETHWLQRTRQTFTYNPSLLAPPSRGSGWSKKLYIGLSHPEPFVWGSADNDRLGLPERRGPGGGRVVTYHRRVDRPASLKGQFGLKGRRWVDRLAGDLAGAVAGRGEKPGGTEQGRGSREVDGDAGIVEMHAGGWSFAARDMAGRVWVWGQLDGSLPAWRVASWEDKHERVPEPTAIPLPCKAETIALGRSHMLILDEDNLIWEQKEWGRAYHHTAQSLTSPTNPGSTRRPHHIIQISAGWTHSACLTSTGKVYVWYPFFQAYDSALTNTNALNGPLGVRDGDASRSLRWGTVSGDVVHEVDALPLRPDSSSKEEVKWVDWRKKVGTKGQEEGEKVVKIASGQGFLVALKGNGEVWLKMIEENHQWEWEYLPHFSSPYITHLSAQFTSLTSYSTSPSMVHHARLPSPPHIYLGFGKMFRPDPLPTLQGKGVIQVAIGDYHSAALTDNGEMWTWGQGDAGQLGLGDVSMRFGGSGVEEPRKVEFPLGSSREDEPDEERKEAFVFAITAAGWHTGALVLGEPNRRNASRGKGQAADQPIEEHTSNRIEGVNMPGAFPSISPRSLGVNPTNGSSSTAPPPRPGQGMGMPQFRIGLAGAHGRRSVPGMSAGQMPLDGDDQTQVGALDEVARGRDGNVNEPGTAGSSTRVWRSRNAGSGEEIPMPSGQHGEGSRIATSRTGLAGSLDPVRGEQNVSEGN